MVVVFSTEGGSTVSKGPYPQLRLEGELMRAAAGGAVIARHENRNWIVDGQPYTRSDCVATASVHFERIDGTRSKTYGPLAHLSFIDGVAYVDREVFAFVDRGMVDWYCKDDGRHWPLMIVQPAG